MTYSYDRTAAGPSPVEQAKAEASKLVDELTRDPQFDDWTGPLTERVQSISAEISRPLALLIGSLRVVSENPSALQDARLGQKLKDSVFVFQGQVDSLIRNLEDWVDKLKKDEQVAKDAFKRVYELADKGKEIEAWGKPVVVTKGKTGLGTKSLKFEVLEITRRGETWTVYRTNAANTNYRIAPDDPSNPKGSGWRIDKGGMGPWEAVDRRTFKTPYEAAAELVDILKL